jgi:hypothetical protein
MIINFFLFLTMSLGQTQNSLPSDFPKLLKMSVDELELKTQAHKDAWGLGKIERWDLSQEKGELVFSLPDGLKAVCPAQIIGTFNSKERTWLWAWDNPSINEKLKADALKVRKYGEQHKIDQLTEPMWKGTEGDAWAMAALAVKLCDEQGAYRGPAGDTYVFIAFGKVVVSKK